MLRIEKKKLDPVFYDQQRRDEHQHKCASAAAGVTSCYLLTCLLTGPCARRVSLRIRNIDATATCPRPRIRAIITATVFLAFLACCLCISLSRSKGK